MRKILWALPLCVIIAGCDRSPADPHGLESGETLLTVTGTGRTEAAPDQALFTAGLSSVAADARSASAKNAEAMSRITAALARLNVPARDIQTRSLSVNRVDYGPNKGRFEASNTLTVRMRDTARVGEAIAAVTDAGANIVSGPNLSIADPEKANLSGYDAAYKAARAKAEAYANAAGLRIGRVLAIHDGGQGGYMPQVAEMDARMAGPPPIVAPPAPEQAPPVMTGTNAGMVTVRVNFALEPK
ncbi:SIMPL domain-containing protein (plasmid) [Sphingobium sp. RSMS]|uniref:SIMPL domain-containing protein n=1 Tax=Sphingobium sp. RSMS TaxID=520734 RepID=UPI0010F9BA0C|nr:SIMPL domain-containing protein [Sphingobium sp. RSMS]UXC93928.1 SIMPL domain-containing protein [Sphingobium sp. RSMS]